MAGVNDAEQERPWEGQRSPCDQRPALLCMYHNVFLSNC